MKFPKNAWFHVLIRLMAYKPPDRKEGMIKKIRNRVFQLRRFLMSRAKNRPRALTIKAPEIPYRNEFNSCSHVCDSAERMV